MLLMFKSKWREVPAISVALLNQPAGGAKDLTVRRDEAAGSFEHTHLLVLTTNHSNGVWF